MVRDLNHSLPCLICSRKLKIVFSKQEWIMTTSTIALAVIAFILLGIAGALGQAEPDKGAFSSPFMKGFGKTCSACALAAILAAIITFFVTQNVIGGLSEKSLVELNGMIDVANSGLKSSWILTLLLCLTVLLFAIVWGKEVKKEHAARIGKVASGLSITKTAFAVLAASTFVGNGVHYQNVENSKVLKGAKSELIEARLALFQQVEEILIAEAMSSAVTTAARENEALSLVVRAYDSTNFLFEFKSTEVVIAEANIKKVTPSDAQTTKSIDAELRNVSLDRIQALGDRIGQEPPTESASTKLADQITEIVLEKAAAGRLKEHFLSFGNPIIDRLIGNIVDPLLVKPLKTRIASIAAKWIDGRIDAKAAMAQARAAGASQAGLVAAKMAGIDAAYHSSESFGFERWDNVRREMAAAITEGRINKPEEVKREMRQILARFQNTKGAISRLFAFAPNRAAKEERAFAQFLKRNPDFAALWGYSAIAFTPEGLETSLEKASLPGILAEKVPLLRKGLAEMGPEFRSTLAEFNLTPESVASLSDTELAKVFYDAHGPFPVDGFATYFTDVEPKQTASAKDYYKGPEVSPAVTKYCPST